MATVTRRRALREQIVALLEAPDFAALAALAGRESGVVGHLAAFLFAPGELLHWRAVEGLGYVAAAQPGQAQKVISRLIYQLNEDSGSFGWMAAAALGELGRHQLPIVEDILPMFYGFLEQDFARKPMLWGLGRLWQVHPQVLGEALPLVFAFLKAPDPQLRGLAAWCLGRVKPEGLQEALEPLVADDSQVELYDREQLQPTTVGQLAREALGGQD